MFKLTTDHNYVYTSTQWPQLPHRRSWSPETALIHSSYSLVVAASTTQLPQPQRLWPHIRWPKQTYHTIPFKDNVYGSGDDGSRSVIAKVFAMSDEVNIKKISKEKRLTWRFGWNGRWRDRRVMIAGIGSKYKSPKNGNGFKEKEKDGKENWIRKKKRRWWK